MSTTIFSTYSTGENRVTSSIIAVLQYLSLQRSERLFRELMGLPDFRFIAFRNQPSKGGEGVPDSEISGSFTILVETKTKRNSVNRDQLERHLKRLKGHSSSEYLLVLTPDDDEPPEIGLVDDKQKRVIWAPFASLDQAIMDLLGDKEEIISEREAFLLKHLHLMLEEEGLLRWQYDVVVVAARDAWPEYKRTGAYICGRDRTFQSVKYMAFYSSGQIHELVPKIVEMHESVDFVRNKYQGRIGEVVNKFLDGGRVEEGDQLKLIILSDPESSETQRLSNAIENDLLSHKGRVTAYTQYQRYVTLARLKAASKTSDLGDSE